jgi:hypothetical protein
LGAAAGSALVVPSPARAARPVQADAGYLALAAEPTGLMVGDIERNRTGAVISAVVIWPDGIRGVFVADEIDERCGAVNAYHVTYGATRRYVQPRVTRDVAGRVVHRPRIRVA